MIDRDQLMEFMREEEFEDTLYTLSDNDKFECLITIAQSVNEDLEDLINEAINKWNANSVAYVCNQKMGA